MHSSTSHVIATLSLPSPNSLSSGNDSKYRLPEGRVDDRHCLSPSVGDPEFLINGQKTTLHASKKVSSVLVLPLYQPVRLLSLPGETDGRKPEPTGEIVVSAAANCFLVVLVRSFLSLHLVVLHSNAALPDPYTLSLLGLFVEDAGSPLIVVSPILERGSGEEFW